MKKISALLLCLLLVLTGCASGADSDTDSSTGSMDEKDSNIVYDGTFGRIVEEPVEITLFGKADGDRAVASEGERFFEFYEETTGVKIVGTASDEVESITDLNLHATEGFPSCIISSTHEIDAMSQYANEGAFVDLNDYLHLMPNLSAVISDGGLGQQAYEATLSSEGEYFLVRAVERFKATHVPMIRKDWLDKVGLPVPQTTEELETALLAFIENDLGADGITVPFVSKHWVLKQNAPVLWGARTESRATGRVVINDEGTEFYHGWSTDEFRTAVTEMSRWYDLGIMSKELFTEDKPKDLYFPTDRGGFTIWSASTIGFNDQPNMPEGFELVPMLFTEYDGVRLDQRATHFLRKGSMGISQACEDKELAAVVLDSFLTEEFMIQNARGIIGEQIELVDTVDGLNIYADTAAWADQILNDFDNNSKNARYDLGFHNIGLSEDYLYATTRFIQNGKTFGTSPVDEIEKMYAEAYESGEVKFVPAVNVTFTPEQQDEASNIKSNLKFYQDEMFSEAITRPYTELTDAWWNDYLDQANQIGMDRLVEIYNEALANN